MIVEVKQLVPDAGHIRVIFIAGSKSSKGVKCAFSSFGEKSKLLNFSVKEWESRAWMEFWIPWSFGGRNSFPWSIISKTSAKGKAVTKRSNGCHPTLKALKRAIGRLAQLPPKDQNVVRKSRKVEKRYGA
ncbi:hypothetical protein TNIN_468271 [Trichonephila inaurata madagascariensis]|uniref:Uncharacterized protein n=1 Tax=Trichonephila inaurata madagascariensis TaxID=2747483 RepID=A0A8X7CKX9_9ARAC|nr:hypothetical protein TNIN_468271 [Trichonephila inaurata madagascariensis]